MVGNKNNILILSIIICTCCISAVSAQIDTLYVDTELSKHIELEFDQLAIANKAFIEWDVYLHDEDELDISFSQGEFKRGTYKIEATNYNKVKGIVLTIKPNTNTKQKVYVVNLNLSNHSGQVGISKDKLNLKWEISYQAPPPVPIWRSLLKYISIALIILIIIFLLHRRSITFTKGIIVIQEPIGKSYNLKGKTKFESHKENCCIDTGISFSLKKGKNGYPYITRKSKDTQLYINKKLEHLGKPIKRSFEVKLQKGDNKIIFKYI